VFTAFLHKGEEPVISVNKGSGTIFFSGCNLKCVYCQNYKFSHSSEGILLSENDLTTLMLKLQKENSDNINLVTPTHFLPQILVSLSNAFAKGLSLPIVYNTSGYEKPEIIALLKNTIDVYLVDLRYITAALAQKYSQAPNYPEFNQKTILQLYQQYPESIIDSNGIIRQGMIIRHLVLPGYIDETKKILQWIKNNTPNALVSIMFQYQPYFNAKNYPEINRIINETEYNSILKLIETYDLKGWVQDLTGQEELAGIHFKKSQLI
jgi:putative pyruvate formate lyase activating enzyme